MEEVDEGVGGKTTRGELYSQRYSVEPSHEIADEAQLVQIGGEPGSDPGGAVEKDRHGGGVLQQGGVCGRRVGLDAAAGAAPGGRDTRRSDRAAPRLVATTLSSGTAVQDRRDKLTHGVEQVLAVVDSVRVW